MDAIQVLRTFKSYIATQTINCLIEFILIHSSLGGHRRTSARAEKMETK